MKQIWLRKNGGPEVLKLEEHPDPDTLGDHEALIDVHYSGINFADVVMRQGLYQDAPPKPFVPGYEVSGVVSAVGKSVRKFKVGDAVVAGSLFGGYASKIKTSEELLFKLPSHMKMDEAAGVAVNWITAHAAIHDMARVRPGDRVMIDSATGGVGTIALQLLKAAGAHTIGLTSSPSKFDYIRGLGAEPMTHEAFRADPKMKDFDLILNAQGGSTVREHYKRLGMTGRIVVFGMSTGITAGKRNLYAFLKAAVQMPRFSIISMFPHNAGVYALNALSLLENRDYRVGLAEKWAEVEKLKIHQHIDRVFTAHQAGLAHEYLESRQARGKVLINWK